MKWICNNCQAINPEFSYTCHNCIEHRAENRPFDDIKIKLTEKEIDLVFKIVELETRINDAELALYNLNNDAKDNYWFDKYFEKYPTRLK